ncbi:MAG: glycosyltransferase family 2 protein [Clostridiales bacterium]|nr:glycosyltransferase family 2 protein [Clostridiales bacterium]
MKGDLFPVSFSMERIDRPDAVKYLEGAEECHLKEEVKPGFVIYPKDFFSFLGKEGWLEVVFSVSNEKYPVLKKNITEIKDLYEQAFIGYHVDNACVENNRIIVQGWAIYGEKPCPVFFQDVSGQVQEGDCRYTVRTDINIVYSLPLQEKSGFQIEIQKKFMSRDGITLVFRIEDSGLIFSRKVNLTRKQMLFDSTRFGKYFNELQPAKWKDNFDFIRKNGLGQFQKELDMRVYPESEGYGYWRRLHRADRRELSRERKEGFPYEPLISIAIPVYKTPTEYFRELVDSVRSQTYANWQLCLADGSPDDSLRYFLKKNYRREKRITYCHLKKNGGISANTNAALRLARGDYIMLCDHDDMLEPNALYEIVKAINSETNPEVIYTDEDKVTMDGKRYFEPNFKPDFNWDMLRGCNYICHIFAFSRGILKQVGGFRKEYDGAQDYDMILRCCEKAESIYHIPKVLYHWRSHPGSTAMNPESKMYAYENGKKAVESHYVRTGIKAEVGMTPWWGWYRTKMPVAGNPLVSVIIPNKDQTEVLDQCLKSVYEKSSWRNFETLVIENNSTDPQTFAYYKNAEQTYPGLRVLYWEGAFNYSGINNFGAREAHGEYLLFLNNDVDVIAPEFMEEMLGFCQREDVGIVGARLLFPDWKIQHVGVILGLGADHLAGHVCYGIDSRIFIFGGRAHVVQDYSAVTAACMMVKRSVHEAVNGFDEEYAVSYNDIDYCLRVGELGKKVVYTPYAELFHYESLTRGAEDTKAKKKRAQKEKERFRARWRQRLEQGDPCYNPNLTLEANNCGLRWEEIKQK